MLVLDVMSSPAITLSRTSTIREAIELLDRKKVTLLPVVDRSGALKGVVSEADLLTELLTEGSDTVGSSGSVSDVMTRLVTSVDADADLEEVVELMATTMLKSLPVVDGGRVVGVISRSDVIHLLATRDDRLRAALVDLFLSERPDWLVEVRDGSVTVTGPADGHERRLAAVLAGSVTGVRSVRVR